MILGSVVYAATSIYSSNVTYDNSGSNLTSTNVQDALDELYDKANSCGSSGVGVDGLAAHITELYATNEKTEVTNNGITYNYATDVSLMNDRRGGVTTSLDGGNVRYYGASPNNYVYFNCDDYSNQSEDTCEKWRIIGVFDGKVKIIRDESLGDLSWDFTSDVTYDNNWTDSTLMNLLNGAYYNNEDTVHYSASSSGGGIGVSNLETSEAVVSILPYGYGETGNEIKLMASVSVPISGYAYDANFKSAGIGLKNDTTRNMIEKINWNLGGWDDNVIYSNQIYYYERGENVYSGNSTDWTGNIALMYSGDYGYAVDFGSCSSDLYSYNYSGCYDNNWLFNGESQWLLNPYLSSKSAAWGVSSLGRVSFALNNIAILSGVRPVLYLNSEIGFNSGDGDGSSSKPYQLSVD